MPPAVRAVGSGGLPSVHVVPHFLFAATPGGMAPPCIGARGSGGLPIVHAGPLLLSAASERQGLKPLTSGALPPVPGGGGCGGGGAGRGGGGGQGSTG